MKYSSYEIVRLNDHFKRMVIGDNGASYVDDENDKHFSTMVQIVLSIVVGKSASKYLMVTGSASQNLKCVSEDEQGDADVMFLSVFPKMTKEDQERALVPCDEPGFFKIMQLNARKYPFVKRDGAKFLNANSLREFEPVWFSKEMQLPLLVVESFDHEFTRAKRSNVASSLDWRSTHEQFSSIDGDSLHKHSHYFLVFMRSYRENIMPMLNENARNLADKLLEMLLRILSFSSMYGTGETKLAIEELNKFGPEFENGLVPVLLSYVRDTEKFSEKFISQHDAKFFIKAHEYFEDLASKEVDENPASRSSVEKKVRGAFDFVPGIACEGFPAESNEWSKRVKGKSWPHPDVVSAVLTSGFHLVPKASKKPGSDPSTSFRLAFNVAEKLLAESLTPFQRECFRVFKMYFYEKLKTEPRVLTTYHLKTVFFWALETSDTNIWHEENRAYCCMLLLQYLRMSLAKTTLQHYFIPGNNLFEYLDKNELKKILRALEQTLADPVSASGETIEKIINFYSSFRDSSPFDEDGDLLESFFRKSSILYEKAIQHLQTSELQELSDDWQIGFLQVLTDPKKIKVLKFCFDMILVRNQEARFHRLFEKYAPSPSPIAILVHMLLPVSNEVIKEVVLPLVPDDSKFKKKFLDIAVIVETASHLSYNDLLSFAMMKNAFSSKGEQKFDMIANTILNLPMFHDEL